MKTYEIIATETINYTADIQAHSYEEAMSIADDMDKADFFECNGEFTIDFASAVDA